MKPVKYVVFFKGTAVGAYNSRENAGNRLKHILENDATLNRTSNAQEAYLPSGNYSIISVVCYDEPDVIE